MIVIDVHGISFIAVVFYGFIINVHWCSLIFVLLLVDNSTCLRGGGGVVKCQHHANKCVSINPGIKWVCGCVREWGVLQTPA
jgi:hypothetical protein